MGLKALGEKLGEIFKETTGKLAETLAPQPDPIRIPVRQPTSRELAEYARRRRNPN